MNTVHVVKDVGMLKKKLILVTKFFLPGDGGDVTDTISQGH